MGQPPPLPESDDPFELLGVDRDTPGLDQRSLKRAYVRLIKVYKPEHAPQEFKRLREAYEVARYLLDVDDYPTSDPAQAGEAEDSVDREDQGDSDLWQSHPEAVAPESPETKEAWALVGEGDVAGAADLLRLRIERGAAPPAVHCALFLVEETRGASFQEASRALTAALDQGVPVAEFVDEVLSPSERRRLVLEPSFAWSTLREQSELGSALTLWRLRLHVLLVEGQSEEVAHQLFTPEVSRDAAALAPVGSICLEASVALAWDQPDVARRLFDENAQHDGLDDYGSLEALHQDRRECLSTWQKAGVEADIQPLATLIKLGNVLDEDLLGEAMTTAQMDVRGRPQEHLEALDRLHAIDPTLISILHSVVEDRLLLETEFSDLLGRDQDDVKDRLAAIDELLDKDSLNSLHSYALGFGILAQIGAFFVFGWWALLGLIALVGIFAATGAIDRRLYAKIIRPHLIELLLSHPISPLLVAGVVRETIKSTQDLSRFDDELEEDIPLHALAWLLHLDGASEA